MNFKSRSRTGRQIIVSWVRSSLLGLVLFVAATYLIDYAVLRLRIAAGKTPFGTVKVRPVYAVPQKNHSTEFLAGDVQDQTCVHSLFPHLGDTPCWYLEGPREPQVSM